MAKDSKKVVRIVMELEPDGMVYTEMVLAHVVMAEDIILLILRL